MVHDTQEHLEEEVTNLLITKHDYTIEEAEAAIQESVKVDPDKWHENSDSAELASYLASNDLDE